MYNYFFKRILDLTFSLIGLILLSPIFLILIIFLRFANKGAGVFFTQRRPGKKMRKYSKLLNLKP